MEIKPLPEQQVFNPAGLDLISTSFESVGHEMRFYFVPPAKTSGRTCQDCDNPAMFILFDKSHDGEKSVNTFIKIVPPIIFLSF